MNLVGPFQLEVFYDSRDIGKENRESFLLQVLLGGWSTETASVLSGSLYWFHKTLPDP